MKLQRRSEKAEVKSLPHVYSQYGIHQAHKYKYSGRRDVEKPMDKMVIIKNFLEASLVYLRAPSKIANKIDLV